jgi:transcription elongation factor GreA
VSDTVVMTAEGLRALQAEIRELEGEGRRAIAERIKTAREWGDLKENAEYHDAKRDQGFLETKILQLRAQELAAEIVEAESGNDTAGFGSTVTFRDEGTGRETTYTLVSGPEAKPGEGLISIDSPVGRALANTRAGDTATVTTPKGERVLAVLTVASQPSLRT